MQNGGIFLLPVCPPRIWGFIQANQKDRHKKDLGLHYITSQSERRTFTRYLKGFGASLYYMLYPIGRLYGLCDIHTIGPNSNEVSTGCLVWWLKFIYTNKYVHFTFKI